MQSTNESRKEFLRNILVGAVEGGIGYWAVCSDYRPDDCRVNIKVEEDDTPSFHRIGYWDIERGLRIVTTGKVVLREDIMKNVLYANLMNDASNIDAEIADCIIQAACFGKVIYG